MQSDSLSVGFSDSSAESLHNLRGLTHFCCYSWCFLTAEFITVELLSSQDSYSGEWRLMPAFILIMA